MSDGRNRNRKWLRKWPAFVCWWLLAVQQVHSEPADACFGGVETFEKTPMYMFEDSVRAAGTLLQQDEQALTRDCIAQCRQQPVCASFTLDYVRYHCAAYSEPSDRPVEQQAASGSYTRVRPAHNESVSLFEKMCLRGITNGEFERVCGAERMWSFERVPDAYLDGFEQKRVVPVSGRADCARLCLLEKSFVCRSADYEYHSHTCRLSREDRRSQPQAFRRQSGLTRDYLENQCASPGPTACLYDRKRDFTLASPDQLVFAESATDCERKCDRERSFTCRAFAFFNKRCLLSADDAPALAESKPPTRSGHIYGEKHCVSEHCSHGLFTYEKVTGHVLRTASASPISLPKQSSSIGITGECRLQCDADPLNCPAFQVNYLSARCDRLDRNSQGRQLELVERDGESYFERVCLRVAAAARSSCRDKLWTFERVLGYELAHAQYDRVLEHVLSRRDCQEFCLQERSFVCRSALYDDESAVCRLSRHDRRSRPSAFIRNNNLRISYLENQCAPPARLCPYQSTSNAYPTYTDLIVNVTGSGLAEQSACEHRCNQSREFLCRSFAFYPSTGECFLSGDDTISGYLSAVSSRSAILYQERKCTARHELMPEPDEDSGTLDDGHHGHHDAHHDTPSVSDPANASNAHDHRDHTEDAHGHHSSSNPTDQGRVHGVLNAPESSTDHSPEDHRSTVNGSTGVHANQPATTDSNDSRHVNTSINPNTDSSFDPSPNRDQSYQPPTQTSTEKATGSTPDSSHGTQSSAHPGRKGWAGTSVSTSSEHDHTDYTDQPVISPKPEMMDKSSKKCASGQMFVFDRVPNFEPIGGQMYILYSDLKSPAIAMECLNICRLSSNCSGFVLDYVRHSCYGLYQEYSISKLDLRLSPGKDFFEGYCVDKEAVTCDRQWAFDRIVDQMVASTSLQPKFHRHVANRMECARACSTEHRFVCRSATFDMTSNMCRMFEHSRESGEIALQFIRGTEYLENQCANYEHAHCRYNSIEQDLTITSITKMIVGHSTFFCEQLCNMERDFICRSYTYLDQTTITHGNLCLLSTDSRYTSLSGAIKYRPRALYAEKQCKFGMMGRKGREKQKPASNTKQDDNSHVSNTSMERSGMEAPKSSAHSSSTPTSTSTSNPEVQFDDPEIEGPPPEQKQRVCSGHQFTYEKVYGKQLRIGRRDRVVVMGNKLIDPAELMQDKHTSGAGNWSAEPLPSAGMAADCQDECSRRGVACRSFQIEYTPEVGHEQCFLMDQASLDTPEMLTDASNSAYFEKICLQESHCNKLWTFERVIGYELQVAARRIWRTSSRIQCQDLCLAERRFVCRSINFDYERRLCRLSDLNRRSRPDSMIRSHRRVEYLENQCINQPDTCKFKQWADKRLPVTDRLLYANNLNECKKMCEHERLFQCRSLTFDTYARQCSLAAEAMSSQSGLSSHRRADKTASTSGMIPSIGPLLHRPATIYAERGACERVSVQCGAEQMRLVLNFDEPFHGKVYTKSNPGACSINGNGKTQVTFDIPLDSTLCGTRQEGSNSFVNEVMVQQHAVVMTELDKTVKVLCSFEQMDQVLTLNRHPNRNHSTGIDVESISGRSNDAEQVHSIVANTAAPPSIVMRILDRSGQDATLVSLGDPLILKIELPAQTNSPFGIQARHLYAKSSEQERLYLLDENGCPIDPLVFPQMQLDPTDNRSLWTPFKAFRFPSTGVVNFEVQIRFCPNRCAPVVCDTSTSGTNGPMSTTAQQQLIHVSRKRRHTQSHQPADEFSSINQSNNDQLIKDKIDSNVSMQLLPDPQKLTSALNHNNAAYGLIYPLPSNTLSDKPINPASYFTNEHWPLNAPNERQSTINPLMAGNFTSGGQSGPITFVSSWTPNAENKKNKKFTAPRPLLRPDGSPGIPKYTEHNPSVSSDKEVPLSLAILVKNDKKKESNRANLDKKRKSSTVHRSAAQLIDSNPCIVAHSGPVILYTTIIITLLYTIIAICGYMYYRQFVKKFTDTKFMCAPTSISVRPNSINSNLMHDNFNMTMGPSSHNKEQVIGSNKIPSVFYGNLNETIRSLANSSVSGYHQFFGQHDINSIAKDGNKPQSGGSSNAHAQINHQFRDHQFKPSMSEANSSKKSKRPLPSQSTFQGMYHSNPSVYGLPP